MMKTVWTALTTLLVTATLTNAGIKAGMNELQVQGSLSLQTASEPDEKYYTASGALIYNYFFAPQVSVGACSMLVAALTDPETGGKKDMVSLFLLGRLDFYLTRSGSAPLIPYVGAHGGGAAYQVDTGDSSDSDFTAAYGGHAGLKFFVDERTSWNVEGNLTQYRPEIEDHRSLIRLYQVMVGYSQYF